MKPRHLLPAIVFALLVAYPLSMGPAYGFFYSRHRFPDTPKWEWVYEPLFDLSSRWPWLDDLLRRYNAFWINLGLRNVPQRRISN